jgi:hypothetical protein
MIVQPRPASEGITHHRIRPQVSALHLALALVLVSCQTDRVAPVTSPSDATLRATKAPLVSDSTFRFDADISLQIAAKASRSEPELRLAAEYHIAFLDSVGVVTLTITPSQSPERQAGVRSILSWRDMKSIRFSSRTEYAEVTRNDGSVITTSEESIARLIPDLKFPRNVAKSAPRDASEGRLISLRHMLKAYLRPVDRAATVQSERSRGIGMAPTESAEWVSLDRSVQTLSNRSIEFASGPEGQRVQVKTVLSNARVSGNPSRVAE